MRVPPTPTAIPASRPERGHGVTRLGLLSVVLPVISLLTVPAPAGAHPAPFSYLDLLMSGSGLRGGLVVHDFDVAHELGLDEPSVLLEPQVAARYRERLVNILAPRLTILVDGEAVTPRWGAIEVLPDRQSLRLPLELTGEPAGAVTLDTVMFPYDPVHQTFINIYEDDALRYQAILDVRRDSLTYYAGTTQGRLAVVRTFIESGIHHILVGPDHILFLFGLLLLGGTVWKLTGVVTAFTVGHSITLSLAALDVLSPSTALVEPAIALSIVVVGVDNILVGMQSPPGGAPVGQPAAPRDLRPWLAGFFGLIHGFGFAAVLREFGLPREALGWSLFSFNVGVEIGQLAIVVVVASLLAYIHRRSVSVSRRLAFTGSVAVVAAGAYWFVQRVWFTGA